MRNVSMPPSVRNSRPARCGSVRSEDDIGPLQVLPAPHADVRSLASIAKVQAGSRVPGVRNRISTRCFADETPMNSEDPTPIDLAAQPDFALGPHLVSPSAREIGRAGGAITLEPRVMQVLVALAQRQGQTVSRDHLIARCWAGV